MYNPLTKLKKLENRVATLEHKNENLYGLVVALSRALMLNPTILQEHYQETDKNLKYILDMRKK